MKSAENFIAGPPAERSIALGFLIKYEAQQENQCFPHQ